MTENKTDSGKKDAGILNTAAGDVGKVLKRLGYSLDALETVVDGHLEKQNAQKDYAAEVQRMGADRVRLAGSLDDAEARCQRLENVNREVSSRLVNAMETIRGVLEKD
jgi:predicted RNA-binding protein YlqC (UPF0109 family)